MKDKAEIAAIAVIVLGVALIAGLVVKENREGTEVLGTRFTQTPTPASTDDPFVIPTIDSTIVPTPTPTPTVVPTATATATATSSPRPSPTSTATTAARPGGLAAYTLSVHCVTAIAYDNGAAQPGGQKETRSPVARGEKHSYAFNYDREENGKQVTSEEKRCTIKTIRDRAGSEPNLRIKLSCDGNGTYESAPPTPSTNVASRAWRPSELTGDGFTHVMKNKPGQISERTTCLVEVV